MCFFLPSAHWIVADFREKTVNLRDKKTFRKKTGLFQEIEQHFFSYVSSLLVFFVALIHFFLNRAKVFFYFAALIKFFEKVSIFFFLIFFYRPPSLDFGFLLI